MSLYIGKIFGIRINLHYTWFFIVLLLAWSLATDYFPADYPGLGQTAYWVLGGIAGILLFACVLAHELSHSVVAKKRGLKVKGITLFFFGGIANASEEGMTPGKEFQVAIAGPIMSVFLGGLFYVLYTLGFVPEVAAVLKYLYQVNLIVAAFNMVPGFPLDGGRILRSIIWKYTDDVRRATKYASNIGRGFGGVLIIWGIISLFTGKGGLWYVLLGGFLYILAKASYEQVLIKTSLDGTRVRSVMRDQFNVADPDKSLESFLEDFKKRGGIYVAKERNNYYVLDFSKLKNMERHEWPVKQVNDIMVEVKPARESHKAWKCLKDMHSQNSELLPVVKNDKITGVVLLDDLVSQALNSRLMSSSVPARS